MEIKFRDASGVGSGEMSKFDGRYAFNNELYSDLQGKTVRNSQSERMEDVPYEKLQEWMADAVCMLTEVQIKYIDEYYNSGLSMQSIATKYGIDKSSVSRSVQRGIAKMQLYVDARSVIYRHTDKRTGWCNWPVVLEQIPTSLIPRCQKEFLLLRVRNVAMSDRAISKVHGTDRSTISHLQKRALEKLEMLRATESYFAFCCRMDWRPIVEAVGGLTKRQRAILLKKLNNPNISQVTIGNQVGCSSSTVQNDMAKIKAILQTYDNICGVPAEAILVIVNHRGGGKIQWQAPKRKTKRR